MSSPSAEIQETVPCFESVSALRQGLAAKSAFDVIDLYPRDGSVSLFQAEERVSRLAGVEPKDTVLFASGMTAVSNAVEVALLQAQTDQPVIAAGQQLYSQTGNYLNNHLAKRGVKVVRFDSGSQQNVNDVVEKHRPNVILSETVANGPDIPVLDIDNLLETAKTVDTDPVVILDNTLPLSTGLPIHEKITTDDNIIVVESGTKSYTFNNELLGIAYSANSQLTDDLRQYRRTVGTMPGLANIDRVLSLLPETKEAFDARNLRLFDNAGKLAVYLSQAQESGGDFIVSHPSLPTHDNYDLASKLPGGGSPLLFLQCISCDDQFDLAARLWDNKSVRDHAELGQSFGFDRARILPDERARIVRVSAGAFTDSDALGAALREASIK